MFIINLKMSILVILFELEKKKKGRWWGELAGDDLIETSEILIKCMNLNLSLLDIVLDVKD